MFKILAQHPWRSTLWLVAGFSLLHLLLIGQVELSGDESHYALYGYYLDWSYFDHPPLVGWLNALILPFSDSEFALRLWPVFLSALSALLLYGMTRELFPDEPAWLGLASVAVFESGVMFQLIGMAMLPDTPLIPLSLAAGWVLFRALQRARLGDWLLLGLLFGLAGLSKYTAVTLVVTALLAIFWLGRGRLLRSIGPWLAVLLAVIVILPVLVWNFQHEWISFLYQLGHGMPQRAWQAKRFLTSQLGQLIAYSPGIYLFGFIAIVSALRKPCPGSKLLLALALPVLLLFGWNGGYETSLPHWPALGWAALAPLIARWLAHHWSSRGVRLGTYLSSLYSGLLILTIAVLILMPWNPFAPNQHPLSDVYGWQQAAERALRLRDAMAQTEGPEPVLFVGNWSIFSHIAWYARPTPVQVTDQRFDQSDLWYGSPQVGARGIVIVPQYYHDRPQTSGTGKFEHCRQEAETVKAMKSDTPAATYFLYVCDNYLGK
ncbi:MAG: glycosyltransferase family 39 protein [Gammaproteobacteria bacterium]|nr:glycosyltransferase family 39 protein [Gammaproteobacteria bacterium]